MKPYRILFTIPNFITAGSGRAMLNIIERLDRTKFDPTVCVLRRGGALERDIEEQGIPVLEAPFTVTARPLFTLPPRSWKASQYFRPYRFDCWHSFHYLDDYTEAIIARLSGARKWIYTKKNMNWYRRSWYLRTLLANGVAAQNSQIVTEFMNNSLFRHKTRLIPTSVDTSLYRPGIESACKWRERFGILAGSIMVVVVAQLVPVKGHPTLIEAVARVPRAHLLIAGMPQDAQYSASLEEMVRSFAIGDRVHFLGSVPYIPGLLSEADISVLPTWARGEGCPVALLESMSCGVLSIATDVPGSRDVIQHNVNGLLIPPEDVKALAEAIQLLADHPEIRQRLSEAARKRIIGRYMISREVADYEALYESVLGHA
jgi:glycosyltransferase involved in cell wall biosynthesis